MAQEKVGSKLESVLNFRDVGLSITRDGEKPAMRPGMLFRSGHIDDATCDDCDILRDEYKIRTIIDLRGLKSNTMTSVPKQCGTPVPQYLNGITQRTILGLTQHNIQLTGPHWFQHQYSKLGWINKAKTKLSVKSYNKSLLRQMVADFNVNRMSFIADAIEYSHLQIKAVFKALALPQAYPVQILDKYGKAQTGLIVCLVLLLLGIDQENIVRDHLKSDQGLASVKDDMTLMMVKLGFPVSGKTMGCTTTFVETIQEHLETKFGGVEAYLLKIGLVQDELQTVKSILRTEEAQLEKEDWPAET